MRWFLLVLMACGTEVARVPFGAPGSAETKGTFKAGDVAVWTDLDVSWQGELAAQYDVTFTQGDKTSQAVCYPFKVNTRVKSVVTNLGDKHDWSYEGKMHCELTAAAGEGTLRATLSVSKGTPAFKKADLVLKQ
jgi:hypothetical protein